MATWQTYVQIYHLTWNVGYILHATNTLDRILRNKLKNIKEFIGFRTRNYFHKTF